VGDWILRTAIAVVAVVAPVYVTPQVASAAVVVATPIATGLHDPTGFTFAPDGRIYYVERLTGRVRILNPATGQMHRFFAIPKADGIVGIALHPDYPGTPYVYLYGTRIIGGVTYAQLIRIKAEGRVGVRLKVLISRPAATGMFAHQGGRLLFGPDRKLYFMIGDEADPATAQDRNDVAGKMLRVTARGTAPGDNPTPGSPIFSSGLRNSIGYDFDPQTGNLWLVDNGPECNDELNLMTAGANYGWGPSETCSTPPPAPMNTNQDGPNPTLPIAWYASPLGPTGLAFCKGCGLGPAREGDLLFGDSNRFAIHDVTLDSARATVMRQSVIYTHTEGIRSIEVGSHGAIYFSDSSGIFRLSAS
jgi:glucose/arabinose dehydrogenase